jgi:hypothetical protein
MRLRVLFALFLFAGVAAHAAETALRVTADVANLRAEASTTARVVAKLKAGDRVKGVESTGEWWRVKTASGAEGFLHASVVEAEPTAAPVVAKAPEPAGAFSVDHKAIDCIVAGRFTRVEARFTPAERVARARVYFRATGTPLFYYVELHSEAGAFGGFLPQAKKETERVEYYVQATDASFAEARTAELGARVVKSEAECKNELAVAALPMAKLVVGGPSGAAIVPVGFQPAGIAGAAAGSGTTAETAASTSSAGKSGGISGKTLAIIGGGAAAVGLVAIAAGGGGDDGPPATQAPRASFANARFEPISVTCSSTANRGGFFSVSLIVDATNPTPAAVTITSASDLLTFVTAAPGAGNATGQTILQENVRFSPTSVPAGGSQPVQFQVPLGFQNYRQCRSFSGTSQLQADLTIVTSGGTFNVRSQAPLNLVYP